MAKEIPQIPLSTARSYAYMGMIHGTDAAPLHGKCLNPRDIPLRGVEMMLPRQLETIRCDPFVDWYGEDRVDPSTGEIDEWLSFVPGLEPDHPGMPKVMTAYVRTRCRKCSECLKHRRRLWTARALAETNNAVRTWFGTLTVRPEQRFTAELEAERVTLTRRAERLDKLSSGERFKAIAGVLAPQVTKWLKRIRAQSGAKLRYLLVVENHKCPCDGCEQLPPKQSLPGHYGFPHFHILLQECSITPCTKEVLQSQWKLGYSRWKLVEAGDEMKGVAYVCKYISKSAQTRVRASRFYGRIGESDALTALLRSNAVTQETEKLPPLSGEQKRNGREIVIEPLPDYT